MSHCAMFLLLVVVFFPRSAEAYIDPGSGHLILQLLIAAGVGSLFYVKQAWSFCEAPFWRQIFFEFEPNFHKPKRDANQESELMRSNPKSEFDWKNSSLRSLRDPDGQLYEAEGRLIRRVLPSGANVAKSILGNVSLMESERLIDTVVVGEEPGGGLVLEHRRVGFPSYPHEWSPEMLFEAGELTLHLARTELEQGLSLKDATPYNVLFEGARPVFVDFLSFEQRNPLDATWLPFAQFVRTFVMPLLAYRTLGLSLSSVFLSHRDGLEPEELYPMLGPIQKFLPPFFSLVTLPALVNRRKTRGQHVGLYQKRLVDSPDKAKFILDMVLRMLHRTLRKAGPRSTASRSKWSTYMKFDYPYSEQQLQQKERFVQNYLEKTKPKWLLDVGCNIGHFSRLAAQAGAEVVAVDSDADVVGRVFCMAKQDSLSILPLVIDLTRPSPALGWRNTEVHSFLHRAKGKFDGALLLAVVHHMMVGEGIPIEEIFSVLAEMSSTAVVEYVGPSDASFKFLLRGRSAQDFGQERFESALAAHFRIEQKERVADSDRCLYWLERKQ